MSFLELMQCSPIEIAIFYFILVITLILSFLLDRYIEQQDFKKFVHDYYNGTLNYRKSKLIK